MSFEQLTHTSESNTSPLRLVIAVACALALVSGLGFGYLKLRQRHAEQGQSTVQAPPSPTPAPAKVQLYEDEPRPRGAHAAITGTVVNTSPEKLANLSVTVELTARNSQHNKEQRVLPLTPNALPPGQKGTYALLVPAQEFTSLRIIAVNSSDTPVCQPRLQKCSAAGQQRPPEIIPDRLPGKIVRPAPAPKPRQTTGHEVINTPETADRY